MYLPPSTCCLQGETLPGNVVTFKGRDLFPPMHMPGNMPPMAPADNLKVQTKPMQIATYCNSNTMCSPHVHVQVAERNLVRCFAMHYNCT